MWPIDALLILAIFQDSVFSLSEKAEFHFRSHMNIPTISLLAKDRDRNFKFVQRLSATELKQFEDWHEFTKQNIWELSGQFEGDLLLAEFLKKSIYNTKQLTNVLWMTKEVPVAFDRKAKFSAFEQLYISSVLSKLSHFTCLKIRGYNGTTDRDYVIITSYETGCNSWLGRIGGPQILNLHRSHVRTGCLHAGTILHLFFHTFGLLHQHVASNRDEFIRIERKNIAAGKETYFRKFPNNPNRTKIIHKYAYSSLMHYSKYAFSKDKDSPTVIPKDPQAHVGERYALSYLDIQSLNIIYRCPAEKLTFDHETFPYRSAYRILPPLDRDFQLRDPDNVNFDSEEVGLAPGIFASISVLANNSNEQPPMISKDDFFNLELMKTITRSIKTQMTEWTPKHRQNLWELGAQTEGDMVLTKSQKRLLHGHNPHPKLLNRLWPQRVVPYEIQDQDLYYDSHENIVRTTLENFSNITCLRVRPRNRFDKNYVLITMDENFGWAAQVGYVRGIVLLNVMPFPPGRDAEMEYQKTMLRHLFMHVLGVYHEHTAPNQQDFIAINISNVATKKKSFFNRLSPAVVTSFGLPYDYESIMHISEYAFSHNGRKTITKLQSQGEIKYRQDLSRLDILKLQRMYNCPIDSTQKG